MLSERHHAAVLRNLAKIPVARGADNPRFTHGLTGTPEHRAWKGMRGRCLTPSNAMFYAYGARGITVCERWSDFLTFLADMGHKPTPRHTIERRDSKRGYSPDNCYWATTREQTRNVSRNVWITHNGETLCLTDWAARVGIDRNTMKARIRRGWPPERIFAERLAR